MPLKSYNDFISRVSAGYWLEQPIWDEHTTITVGLLGNNFAPIIRGGFSKTLPDPLPSGVTGYIVTSFGMGSTLINPALLCKLIDLGSLNIAGPTFTDGVSMPTVTELGVSRVIASAVIAECTTALNATPGSITITYVDQDGNTAETTTAQTLTASTPIRDGGYVVLNSGDWGARDITTATRTGGTTPTGVIQFWGVVPIAMVNTGYNSSGTLGSENLLTTAFNPVRLGAGDKLAIFQHSSHGVRANFGNIFIVGDN